METRSPATGPSHDDLLLVEDLLLLLVDDDGASIQQAGTLHYALGGALLAELGLLGRVEVDDSGIVNGPRVTPTGEGPLPDPLLQSAYDTVAKKSQRVQPLLLALGVDLWRVVVDRLVDRGLLRRQVSRRLGIFRSTRLPAADGRHEAELRARILRVLEDGEAPDPRTAATIGLLYASGAMPSLRPALPWTSQTVARAQALEQDDWSAQAVSAAVMRTTGAIASGVVAASSAANAGR